MAFQASAGPHAKAEFDDSDQKDQNGNRQGHQATSFPETVAIVGGAAVSTQRAHTS